MDASDGIVVNAHWQVGPGSMPEVRALVAQERERSLTEAGCVGYEVYQGIDSPDQLLLVERYRDAAALEAHRATRHFQELVVGRIVPLLSARRVERLRPI